MPALAFGNNAIEKMYFGDNEVRKMYLGGQLAFEPGEITTHRIVLGTPDITSGNDRANILEWTNAILSPYPQIPAAFVEGGGAAYLAYFYVRWNGDCILHVHNASTGSSGSGGQQDLVSAWETNNDDAIVLTAGGRSISLPGPAASSSRQSDSTDPYEWEISRNIRTNVLRPWLTRYDAMSAQEQAQTAITLNIPSS